MEDPGAGDYREARMRKGWGESRSFIHIQQNKLLSEVEIHGPYPSAISTLPETYWHITFHLPLVLLHQGWHPAVFLTAGYLQWWGIT